MRRRPERQFYFRLAAHLGTTVAELLARVSSRELTEWMAYEKISGPLGGRRLDVVAAIVASTVLNTNRRKGTAPIKPDDMIPRWDNFQSDEDVWDAIRKANAAMGGEVTDPD